MKYLKSYILLLPAFAFATPNAPSNLTFTDITKHSVSLNWVDNSDDESGFKIYKNGDLLIKTEPNIDHFVVGGLKPDTEYFFIIKATDDTLSSKGSIFSTNQKVSQIPNDDAQNQRGVARSYTKNSGIITDNVTHLEWQDNTSSEYRDYAGAVAYCQNLNIEGTSSWRLPNIEELRTLVDYGSSPRIDPTFDTKRGAKYWSISEYPYDKTNLAYFIDFSRGFSADYGDRGVFEKSKRYAVRCVKGESLQPSNFTTDGSNIVTDTTTNLMWEDTEHINRTSSVEDAMSYCESLKLGGFNDWKLPNINELYSITDTTHYDSAINETFQNRLSIGADNENEHYRAANYWSTTYYGPNDQYPNVHYYRTLNARDGASHRCRSYMGMHTRCVRSK